MKKMKLLTQPFSQKSRTVEGIEVRLYRLVSEVGYVFEDPVSGEAMANYTELDPMALNTETGAREIEKKLVDNAKETIVGLKKKKDEIEDKKRKRTRAQSGKRSKK